MTEYAIGIFGPWERLVRFRVEVEREEDGRWIAEIGEIPGAMAHGVSREAAIARVRVLAFCSAYRDCEAAEARVEELEEALHKLDVAVRDSHKDCGCGEEECFHIATTDAVYEAIVACVKAARALRGGEK